jgi:cleavage and polyadenylation specificity factor subunit 1
VADLGDSVHKDPYLILQTSSGDITTYLILPQSKHKGCDSLRFVKSESFNISEEEVLEEHNRGGSLRLIRDLAGLSCVFVRGNQSVLLLKTAKSPLRHLPIAGSPVKALCGLYTGGCDRGFIYIDSTVSQTSELKIELIPMLEYHPNMSNTFGH